MLKSTICALALIASTVNAQEYTTGWVFDGQRGTPLKMITNSYNPRFTLAWTTELPVFVGNVEYVGRLELLNGLKPLRPDAPMEEPTKYKILRCPDGYKQAGVGFYCTHPSVTVVPLNKYTRKVIEQEACPANYAVTGEKSQEVPRANGIVDTKKIKTCTERNCPAGTKQSSWNPLICVDSTPCQPRQGQLMIEGTGFCAYAKGIVLNLKPDGTCSMLKGFNLMPRADDKAKCVFMKNA